MYRQCWVDYKRNKRGVHGSSLDRCTGGEGEEDVVDHGEDKRATGNGQSAPGVLTSISSPGPADGRANEIVREKREREADEREITTMRL